MLKLIEEFETQEELALDLTFRKLGKDRYFTIDEIIEELRIYLKHSDCSDEKYDKLHEIRNLLTRLIE
jgi:hypothetical protein